MLPIALGLAVAAAQAPCAPDAEAVLAAAAVRIEEFDLEAASARLAEAPGGACATIDIAALYLRGLLAAREAFRQGAPPESLAPVHQAIVALEEMAQGRPGPAAIARLALQAAAAGAQSERDEMSVYLAAANDMESLQHAARLSGPPLLSTFEVGGDLWLQLYGYAEARRLYIGAMHVERATARAVAGLARTAARLELEDAACWDYRRLLERWGTRRGEPPEISEARKYVQRPSCAGGDAPPPSDAPNSGSPTPLFELRRGLAVLSRHSREAGEGGSARAEADAAPTRAPRHPAYMTSR